MAAKDSGEDIGKDVQIIREILFGEPMKALQGNIEALEKETASLRSEIRKLQKALASEEGARLQSYQATEDALGEAKLEQDRQISALEAKLVKRLVEDGKANSKDIIEAQNHLSAKIDKLSNQTSELFKEHEHVHEDLINSLAMALLKFQQKSTS